MKKLKLLILVTVLFVLVISGCEFFDFGTNYRLTKSYRYESDGTLSRTVTYTYIEDNIREKGQFDYADSSRDDPYELYVYDDNGLMLKTSHFSSDGILNYYVDYTYNSSDLMTQYIFVFPDAEPEIVIKHTFEYDSEENLTRVYKYNPSGELSTYVIYTYDGKQLAYFIEYDYDTDQQLYKTEYEYDENGNESKCLEYNYNPIDEIFELWMYYTFEYEEY